MQLSNDTAGPAQIITGYGPAELRIGERVITSSSIITADRVLPWPVVSIADLTPALLEPALALGDRKSTRLNSSHW